MTMATCYYKTQLKTEKEKRAYDCYVDGIMSRKEYLRFNGVDRKAVDRVTRAAILDHPELLLLKEAYSYEKLSSDFTEIKIYYKLSREDSEMILRTLDAIAKRLIYDAKKAGCGSDLEIAAYLHDFLTDRICYTKGDTGLERNHNVLGGLVNLETVCDGYAQIYLFLLDKAGIPALYVGGRIEGGSDAGHAWNCVCIDGVYYNVDVTADSNGRGRKGDWHSFMLSDDDLRQRKYLTDNDAELPECPCTMKLNRTERRIA